MVPANRLGSAQYGGPFSLWELKVIQEVVSLVVFTLFVLVFMKSDELRWNHLAGFVCLVLAVYFISGNKSASVFLPIRPAVVFRPGRIGLRPVSPGTKVMDRGIHTRFERMNMLFAEQ